MRVIQVFSRTALGVLLLLTGLGAGAQQRPQGDQYAGNDARLLGRAYVYQAKPGMAEQFENGVKRHMAWHKAQGDPWSWETWEITTGQGAGQYLIVTMPSWSELASWDDQFGTGQIANSKSTIQPFSEFQSTFYWVYRDDLSRPTPGSIGMLPKGWANPTGSEVALAGNQQPQDSLYTPSALGPGKAGSNMGHFYAASTGWPMVQLVNYQLKPEYQTQFMGALHKIRDAMVKTNWQPKQGYFWYELGIGGDEPQMTLLLPKASWTEITSPTGQMAEIGGLFSGVLEAAYGKAEADRLLQTLGQAVQRKWTDVVIKRNDLSYVSPKSKLMGGSPAAGIP